MKNKLFKNAVLYVKYPYTAIIIATIWLGTAIIISKQNNNNFELLVIVASIATLIIAFTGLRPSK